MRSPLAAVLTLVLALGCTDSPTTPATLNDGNPPAPAFNFTNNPNAGPNIIRGQDFFAILFFDADRGMQAVLGTDIVQFCLGNVSFDLWDFQDVNVPEDANRISTLLHGDDVTTSVWPLFGFDCSQFLSTTPLATGTSDARLTDNDLNTLSNPDSKNHNAFGFRAHGHLTDASGARVRFNGHQNCVWDGNDFSTLRCNNVIILK